MSALTLVCCAALTVTTYAAANQPLSSTNYVTISGLDFDGGNQKDHTPSSYVSSGSCQTTSWTSATTVSCHMRSATTALSSFTEHVGYGCGAGNNLETWTGKANEECAAHCLDLPGCVGFLFQGTVCKFKSDTSGSSQWTGKACYKRSGTSRNKEL